MNKSLKILLFTVLCLALTACSQPQNKTSDTEVGVNGKEDKTEKHIKELMPLDELDIFSNEPETYEGRPFENMPVIVERVERYTDKKEIIVSLEGDFKEIGISLVLLSNDRDLDVNEGDFLLVNGIVRNDLENEIYTINLERKAVITSFKKVEYLDLYDEKKLSKELGNTLSNSDYSVTLEKVDSGDKFTRIYYSLNEKVKLSIGDYYEVLVKQNGIEIDVTEDNITYSFFVRYQNDKDINVAVFDNFDIEKPYSVSFKPKKFMDNVISVDPLEFQIK